MERKNPIFQKHDFGSRQHLAPSIANNEEIIILE